MQLPLVVPILVVVGVQFTWMKLAALAMKANLQTALEALLSIVVMTTEMMREYDVKVWRNAVFMLHFECQSMNQYHYSVHVRL